jgi:hypothetical protein
MPSLTIRYRRFSDGIDIVGSSLLSLTNNSNLSLTAPATVIDSSDPNFPATFAFLFWNVKAAVTASETATVADVGTAPFNASAWYLPVGKGGGGTPTIGASTFSITQDAVLNTTPILSVTPPAAWPGGNSGAVVTTGGPVVIQAKPAMSSENFTSWVLFAAGMAAGPTINAPQDSSGIALATYAEPAKTRPSIPDIELELVDIFDRIRGRLKDWVFDPAPIDVLRITGQFREATRGTSASISELTGRIDQLTPQQLQLLHSDLKGQYERLQQAIKTVEAAQKRG